MSSTVDIDREAELVDLDRQKSAFHVPQAHYDTTTLLQKQSVAHFMQYPGPASAASATEVCNSPYEEIPCTGCGYEIRDRYMLKVMDESWHETCLRCFACQRPLSASGTCFAKDGHIYCREDHSILFGRKCRRCANPLLPTDMVFRCLHATYHAHCFTCYYCAKPFTKGDEYLVFETEIVCTTDYSNIMFQAHQQIQSQMDFLDQGDGSRKTPKRPRTILNAQQRKQFKAAFEKSSKPCRKVREQLAKETGLSVRVVQVWFQNQRAKMKKMQRKEGDSAGRSVDSEGKSVEDTKSDSEEDPDSDADAGEPSETGAESHLMRHEGTQNPIARLYNMQSTYFQFA